MSHWVHGVEWFEARGEAWRGWVWTWKDQVRYLPDLAYRRLKRARGWV